MNQKHRYIDHCVSETTELRLLKTRTFLQIVRSSTGSHSYRKLTSDLKTIAQFVRSHEETWQWRSCSRSLLASSVYIREDPIGDTSTVGLPCQSVLGPTLSLIAVLSVDQQDGEIYDVEVRQQMWEAYSKEKHTLTISCSKPVKFIKVKAW